MPAPPQSVPDLEGFVRSLVTNVPGAVYRCDDDDAFTMHLLGDEIERITGYPASDFVGNARRTFESIIHPDDRELVHREIGEALDRDEPYALEYRIVTADGELRWVLDRGLRAADASGRACLDGIIFDITRRQAAEEERRRADAAAARAAELEASRARIIAAADAARRRLERDLHDGAQQRLVAASLALRMAERRLVENPDSAAMLLVRARTELEAGLDELRELARGIHPAVLTEHGLPDALRSLGERAGVPVKIECALADRLHAGVETALYYCAAEALTNVVKHARATHARVRLVRGDGAVALEVEDDGDGGAQARGGSGLRGLEDRLAALGGTLEVYSVRGRGTVLRATVPAAAPS
jgi:PAS domain S-box-containing protein